MIANNVIRLRPVWSIGYNSIGSMDRSGRIVNAGRHRMNSTHEIGNLLKQVALLITRFSGFPIADRDFNRGERRGWHE
jgi:hypothetical protein